MESLMGFGIRDWGFAARRSGMAAMLAASFALAPCVAFAQQAPTAPPAPPAGEVVVDDVADVADAPAAEAAAPDAAAAATPTPGAMDPAPAEASLLPVYKAFGEEAGLVALMDDFMVRLVADPRTHRFFAEADQVAIKKHLVEQFCVILGGGCAYTGRDMAQAHAGLGIRRAAFNALVEDLQLAMDARKIPFRAQNRLLAKLAPMHRDIEHR
jgi:hemoglobin